MQGISHRIIRVVGLIIVLTTVCVGVIAAQGEIAVIVNEVTAEPIPEQAAYQVTAYVTVTGSDGQPITDLSADAFTVSQDGVEVQLDAADITQRPATIVLVIDTSGSMAAEGKMGAVQTAAVSFVNGLGEGDHVAVIYFNDEVEVAQNLSDDLQAATTIIGLLEAVSGSGTCLYDAAYTGVSMATAAPPGQRAVLLLTDGIDELPDQSGPCSEYTVEDVISLATESTTRVPIYTIGVGTRIDQNELSQIADRTGGASLIAPAASDVAALFDAVAAQLKNQYALTYRAETTSGEHNLTVTVDVGGATAVGTRRFVAPELPPMLNLSGLDDGAILEGSGMVRATVSGSAEVTRVTFTLDGETVAESDAPPFEITLDGDDLEGGEHTLEVTAVLANGAELDESLSFEVQVAPIEPQEGPASIEEEPAELPEVSPENAATAALPPWALPVGIGVSVLLLVLVVVLVARGRKPHAQVIGGTATPRGDAAAEDLTMDIDMAGGDAFGILTVEDSLSLNKGQSLELAGDLVRLGRGADNDVIVPDAPISRNHAEIHRLGDGSLRIFDLGSTYGTFVNDMRCAEDGLPLADGDTVRLGTRTVMTFKSIWQPQVAAAEDRTVDIAAETLYEDGTIPIESEDDETLPMETPAEELDDDSTLAVDSPPADETVQAAGDDDQRTLPLE